MTSMPVVASLLLIPPAEAETTPDPVSVREIRIEP